MSFFRYDQLYRIHIELTNKCNAGCPMCPRNIQGAVALDTLNLTEITLDVFKSFFPPDIVQQVSDWVICGGTGDPCVTRDLVPIMEYIKTHRPNSHTHMNTNGGMRNPEFWKDLAHFFTNDEQGQLIFSIDGLEDTNHLYRRNVRWADLMNNVQSFNDAGGRSNWEFLIFQHNEHQIEEAKQLSRDMGCLAFVPKKSLGFNFTVDGNFVPYPVYNKDGTWAYNLNAPTLDSNRNNSVTEMASRRMHITEKIDIERRQQHARHERDAILEFNATSHHIDNGREDELNSKNINCKSIHGNNDKHEIYIGHDGTVFPCCYIGTIFYLPNNMYDFVQVQNAIVNYGIENANLYHKPLKEIYNSNYFNMYEDTWNITNIRNGKLAYCAATCGENNPIDDIWTHSDNERPDNFRD